MAPPDAKARQTIHLAKLYGHTDDKLWNDRRLSRGIINLAMSTIAKQNYGPRDCLQTLPVELQLEIVALLDLKSLIKLRTASRHWRDIVNHCDSRKGILHPARQALLDLYDDIIETPGFLESRSHILPRIEHFDRDRYIRHLSARMVPDEFEFWVREWPSKAVIGNVWPGFQDTPVDEMNNWWRVKAANMLHAVESLPYEDYEDCYQETVEYRGPLVQEQPDRVQADILEISRGDRDQTLLILGGAGFLDGGVYFRSSVGNSHEEDRMMTWIDFLKGQMIQIGKAWTHRFPVTAAQGPRRMTGLDLDAPSRGRTSYQVAECAFRQDIQQPFSRNANGGGSDSSLGWQDPCIQCVFRSNVGRHLAQYAFFRELAAVGQDILAEIDDALGFEGR